MSNKVERPSLGCLLLPFALPLGWCGAQVAIWAERTFGRYADAVVLFGPLLVAAVWFHVRYRRFLSSNAIAMETRKGGDGTAPGEA